MKTVSQWRSRSFANAIGTPSSWSSREISAIQERERTGAVVGWLADTCAILGQVATLTVATASADGQVAATRATGTEERPRATEDELGIAACGAGLHFAENRLLFTRAAIGLLTNTVDNRRRAVVATIGCASRAGDRDDHRGGREGPHHPSVTHRRFLSLEGPHPGFAALPASAERFGVHRPEVEKAHPGHGSGSESTRRMGCGDRRDRDGCAVRTTCSRRIDGTLGTPRTTGLCVRCKPVPRS